MGHILGEWVKVMHAEAVVQRRVPSSCVCVCTAGKGMLHPPPAPGSTLSHEKAEAHESALTISQDIILSFTSHLRSGNMQ